MWKHMLTHAATPRAPSEAATATVVGIPSMDELTASPVPSSRRHGRGRANGGVRATAAASPAVGASGSPGDRPVSVHGSTFHSHSIYANTGSPLLMTAAAAAANGSAKMNGGLNLTGSAPTSVSSPSTAAASGAAPPLTTSSAGVTGAKNTSMHANLNLSALNSSSGGGAGGSPSGGASNQTRSTSVMDNTTNSSRDHSHHSLNTTQLSPIGGGRQHQHHQHLQQQQHQQQHNVASVHRQHGGARSHNHQYNNNVNILGNATVLDGSSAAAPFNSTYRHNMSTSAPAVAAPNGGLNITSGRGGGGGRQTASSSRNSTISRDKDKSKLNGSVLLPANVSRFMLRSKEAGVREMIVSLGLLCLVSLLLALLSLVFLLEMSPGNEERYEKARHAEAGETAAAAAESDRWRREGEVRMVFQVTRGLCAVALSLNLCCLLVCAIQFLFAVKLVRAAHGGRTRTNKYLKKASLTRVCAITGFFVSIPVFLTGIILYTYLLYPAGNPGAVVTAVLIGLGIVFCGAAVVHNVFVWQREKMKSGGGGSGAGGGGVPLTLLEKNEVLSSRNNRKSNLGLLPQATLDLSSGADRAAAAAAVVLSKSGLELSTLV